MTAVEWLIDQLSIDQYPNDIPKILKQAKEMEHNQRGYTKEDVLKAGEIGEINHHDYNNIVKLLDVARIINETDVSDDNIDNINEIVKSATISKKEMVEISDEEIEKAMLDRSDLWDDPLCFEIGWKDAIKWYREQLRQRK